MRHVGQLDIIPLAVTKNVGDAVPVSWSVGNNGPDTGFVRLVLAVFGVGTTVGALTTVPVSPDALRVSNNFFPAFQPGVNYTALLAFNENDEDGNLIGEMATHTFTINVPAPPPPPVVVLRVPTGVNLISPGDIADDLIRSGNLSPFLSSVSFDGAAQIKAQAALWAGIWTQNVSFMTFASSDVIFLVDQLPAPLPFEQIAGLVANAVLNI